MMKSKGKVKFSITDASRSNSIVCVHSNTAALSVSDCRPENVVVNSKGYTRASVFADRLGQQCTESTLPRATESGPPRCKLIIVLKAQKADFAVLSAQKAAIVVL